MEGEYARKGNLTRYDQMNEYARITPRLRNDLFLQPRQLRNIEPRTQLDYRSPYQSKADTRPPAFTQYRGNRFDTQLSVLGRQPRTSEFQGLKNDRPCQYMRITPRTRENE